MNNKIIIATLAIVATLAVTSSPVFAYECNKSGMGLIDMLKEKAQILGMSSEELAKLREEKTILEIAEEKGVSQEEFRSKVQEQKLSKMDVMIKSGELTQERYDYMKNRMAERKAGGYQQKQGGRNGNCINNN